MFNILKKKFPFTAVLKNGKEITIHNYYEAYLTSFGITEIESEIKKLAEEIYNEIK